jgi:hypothetical protein
MVRSGYSRALASLGLSDQEARQRICVSLGYNYDGENSHPYNEVSATLQSFYPSSEVHGETPLERFISQFGGEDEDPCTTDDDDI